MGIACREADGSAVSSKIGPTPNYQEFLAPGL